MATRILFVDDNKDTLFYIQFMLQRRGYEVVTAASGLEALQMAKREPPDLFLLDVLMPKMNGFEVTQAIRADPQLRHLPIILFSAATTAEHKTRGFEVGADDYLTKPILNDELDNRIQAALLLATVREQPLEELVEPAVTHRGRVFGCWGSKGGVGTTTLVVNTAVALAQQLKVIVCDLNVGLGSMVLQLGLQVSAVSHSPWTVPPRDLTQELVQEALVRYVDQMHLLLMPEGERWTPTVPAVDAVLGHLRALADVVVLDLGAGVTPDKMPILHCCDHVVLVSGADRVASALAEYALEEAADLRIPRERISVVMVQRRDTTGMLTPQLLERNLRLKLDAVIPIAQDDALWAFEHGVPVVSSLRDSPLAQSYRRFSEKLAVLATAE